MTKFEPFLAMLAIYFLLYFGGQQKGHVMNLTTNQNQWCEHAQNIS